MPPLLLALIGLMVIAALAVAPQVVIPVLIVLAVLRARHRNDHRSDTFVAEMLK